MGEGEGRLIREIDSLKSYNEYGHKKMIVWQMSDKLDILIQDILKGIPRVEFKLREQIDSASDSVGSNFVEGYYSDSLGEYIRFCKYSKRSIGELQERIRRTQRKGYVSQEKYNEFDEVSGKTMYLFDRLISSLQKKRIMENSFKKKNL